MINSHYYYTSNLKKNDIFCLEKTSIKETTAFNTLKNMDEQVSQSTIKIHFQNIENTLKVVDYITARCKGSFFSRIAYYFQSFFPFTTAHSIEKFSENIRSIMQRHQQELEKEADENQEKANRKFFKMPDREKQQIQAIPPISIENDQENLLKDLPRYKINIEQRIATVEVFKEYMRVISFEKNIRNKEPTKRSIPLKNVTNLVVSREKNVKKKNKDNIRRQMVEDKECAPNLVISHKVRNYNKITR